jgi:hypothetical protein
MLIPMAKPRFHARGVTFDGSNDYLTRGADLTSVVDGKSGIISFWIDIGGSDGANQTIMGNTAVLGDNFYVARSTGNVISVACDDNNSGTLDLVLTGDINVVAASGWQHVLVSWDVNAAAAHMYITDVEGLAVGATLTNDTLNYAGTSNFSIGAETDGGVKLTGDLAEVWVKFNSFLDFSVEANRRLFIDSDLKPADLGPLGTRPGITPDIYLAGKLANWHTNRGTGGGFTVNGALAAGGSPSS